MVSRSPRGGRALGFFAFGTLLVVAEEPWAPLDVPEIQGGTDRDISFSHGNIVEDQAQSSYKKEMACGQSDNFLTKEGQDRFLSMFVWCDRSRQEASTESRAMQPMGVLFISRDLLLCTRDMSYLELGWSGCSGTHVVVGYDVIRLPDLWKFIRPNLSLLLRVRVGLPTNLYPV